MATARISDGRSDDDKVLDNASCPICLEVYRSPKSLPCLHTFCKVCLDAYIVNLDENSALKNDFACPVCRKVTNTPAPGEPPSVWADNFPSNYALMSVLETNTVKEGMFCDPCSEEEKKKSVHMFCADCKEYLCTECVVHHRKLKLTKGHVLLEKGNVPSDSVIHTREGIFDTECTQHKGKQLEYFCKDHDVLCCSTCAIVDHRRCNEIVEIKTESSNIQSCCDETNENLQKMKDSVEKISKSVQDESDKIQNQLEGIPRAIEELRQRMITVIDQVEERLQKEKSAIWKEESMYASEKKARCVRLAAAIGGAIKQLDSVSKYGSESDIFITRHKLHEQLKGYDTAMKEEQAGVRSRSVSIQLDSQLNSLLEQPSTLLKVGVTTEARSEIIQRQSHAVPPRYNLEQSVQTGHEPHVPCKQQ